MLGRLEEYRKAITKIGASASLRGEGSGVFVFSEKSGRAIEASLNNEEWWLEFWEASNDPDA